MKSFCTSNSIILQSMDRTSCRYVLIRLEWNKYDKIGMHFEYAQNHVSKGILYK